MLSAKESLTTLLSLEGFFFTALTVTISIARSARFGEVRTHGPFVTALCATLVLAFIAAGAVTGWASIYGHKNWPENCAAQFRAIAILAAIVAQPVFAFILAWNARHRD